MFCGKCGSEIAEGAKFCGACGAAVEMPDEEKETAETQNEESAAVETPETEAPKAEASETETPEAETPKAEAPKTETPAAKTTGEKSVQNAPAPSEKEKTNHGVNALTIAIVAAIVLLVVGAGAFVFIKVIPSMGDKGTNQMAYVKDERIYYLKDMNDPDKAIEVDRVRDLTNAYMISFSEDGKYMYYYSKVDSDDSLYTLSRVKVSKLREDGNHDKYLEEVASNIYSYDLTDNNVVYYRDKKDRLIRNKDGKELELEKDITEYYVNEKDQAIYYAKGDYGDLEIGYINLSDGEANRIDKNVSYLHELNEDGLFVYCKDEDEYDGVEDLYAAKGRQEAVRIAEDIHSILSVDAKAGVVYYDYTTEKAKKLYDFVDDTAKDADAAIKEPTVKDALVAITEDEAFDGLMDEYDKEEYLTGKKRDKKRFLKTLSYDEDVQMAYSYSWYDDNTYYYDESATQWYRYDEDKYDELYDKFESIKDRVYLREDLQEEEYEYNEYTVCKSSVNESAEKVICEEVLDPYVRAESNLILYHKATDEFKKMDMAEVDNTEDVRNFAFDALYNLSKQYYRVGSGQEYTLSLDGSWYVAEDTASKLALAHYVEDDLVLYYAEIQGDKLSEPVELTNDFADAAVFVENTLYYFTNEDELIGDLYCYKNGKNDVVKKNISIYSMISGDDMVIVHEDDDLKLYSMSGEETRAGRDVDYYTYISKRQILYSSDDNLYLYTPKDSRMLIAKDVDSFITYAQQHGECEETYSVVQY